MGLTMQDTIFALSSGSTHAGVAIIRLSGPKSRFALETMTGRQGQERCLVLNNICSSDGELLDHGMTVWFAGPASFTGEDCAEFHLHGSRAVVHDVIDALSRMEGFRPAEPGEFTMRAFQNGKIDLTSSEALADLIDAETAEQRRFALNNYGHGHNDLYEKWRRSIIEALAEMTAEIDFVDEADVEDRLDRDRFSKLRKLADEIDSHMKRFRAGEIIREGYRIVIVGRPNAGKSSLLNRLAERDVAIVTDIPGTTRDLLEVSLDLNGRKVTVLDTAGIWDSDNPVEEIGIDRALEAAKHADLVIHLVDASCPGDGLEFEDFDVPVLVIGNKSDVAGPNVDNRFDELISAKDGTGFDRLLERVNQCVVEAVSAEGPIPFRQRHMPLLGEAHRNLVEMLDDKSQLIEIRAECLRSAAHHIGRITGRVDVEDILDVIFSRFCIGK